MHERKWTISNLDIILFKLIYETKAAVKVKNKFTNNNSYKSLRKKPTIAHGKYWYKPRSL